MNRIYVILIMSFAIMQACGGVKRVEKKPHLTTTPEKLNLMVNQQTDPYTIPVAYTLNVPQDYLPSCARLVYSPRFVASGHEYLLTPIVITGKNYNRLEIRQQLLDGKQPDYPNAVNLVSTGGAMQIKMKEQVPFELWMPDAKLQAKVTFEACDRQTELYTQELAGGVLYLPMGPGPALVKYVRKEVKKKVEGMAWFYYPVNGYTIDPALYNNREQLDSMKVLMRRIMTDTAMHINKVVITGICSPDGTWGYNKELARRRADYISNYLVMHENIAKNLIDTRYVVEDWKGLANLISISTLPNKGAVLKIVNSDIRPGLREAELRKLPQFNYIKENFYPQLRKVTYEIYYTVKEMVEEVIPE